MCVQEIVEPLADLKQGIEDLRRNRTFKYILATLLSIGNFLNGVMVSGCTKLIEHRCTVNI